MADDDDDDEADVSAPAPATPAATCVPPEDDEEADVDDDVDVGCEFLFFGFSGQDAWLTREWVVEPHLHAFFVFCLTNLKMLKLPPAQD